MRPAKFSPHTGTVGKDAPPPLLSRYWDPTNMWISIDTAYELVLKVMTRARFTDAEARIIADHLVGCELRGVASGGFSRALSIVERMAAGRSATPMRVVRETPVSALLDGGDQTGYLVAHRAAEIALDKAKASGLAAVSANNTWYTGMYAHYLEKIAREGFVALCAGSSSPRVAPFGSSEGCFGTNPIAFGFPCDGDPIVVDTATSALIVGDVVLASRLGEPLPEGYAYDPQGQPTTDPAAALAGAIGVWGGHRGSALAIAIQLLGVLAGAPALPADYRDCGFFIMVLRPDLFMPAETFRARVAAYASTVRNARPLSPDQPVRMPFDRSVEHRRRCVARGELQIDTALYAELTRAAA